MIRNGADNDIYVLQGNSLSGFYKYSISGNSWTTLTAVPGAVYYGGTMIRNGADNDIYVLRGNDSTGFYKYSISGNSWTTLTAVPGAVYYGGTMIRNGADNEIYVLQGSSTGFYKYSISGNSWTTLKAVPGIVRYGGALIRNGAGNDIYVLSGNVVDNAPNAFSRYFINITTHSSSGTYTSGPVDSGQKNLSWGNASWSTTLYGQTLTIKARSSVTADFSSATAWASCGNLTSGDNLTSASPNCVNAGDRYVQYQASLSTTNTLVSPLLNDLTLNYNYYPTNQTLTSSAFNTQDVTNAIGKVLWNQTVPSGTNIKFQIRTAPDSSGSPGAWTSWEGPSGVGMYFTDAAGNQSMPSDLTSGSNDQWFQYRATLNSDGLSTPTLSQAQVQYIVNATPELQNVTAVQNNDTGSVTVNYQARDADTETGQVAVTLQYCTANCASPGSETWTDATTVSGDVGAGQSVASTWSDTRTLTWTPKTDYHNQYNPALKVRVKANDSQIANNLGYGSVTISLDTKNPQNPTVAIDRSKNSGQITIGVADDTTNSMEYALAFPNAAVDGTSDGCDFSSPSWQSFTYPQMTLNFPGNTDNNDDVRKVCAIFKDKYGNIAANLNNYAISPRTPVSFQYYDVSNPTASDYQLFLSWSMPETNAAGFPGGFSQYEVYRCRDSKNNAACTPSVFYTATTSKMQNYLTEANNVDPNNMDPNYRYCYKVRFKDQNPDPSADYSKWSETECSIPGSGASSLTKNVSIHWYSDTNQDLNIPPSQIYTTQATIKWQTFNAADPNEPLLADSKVEWKIHGSGNAWESYSTPSYVSDHVITIPGKLLPNTEYDYRVASTTPWNSTDIKSGISSFTTKPGPVIENVVTSSLGNNSAIIEWDTRTAKSPGGVPVAASSIVWFSSGIDSGGNLYTPQNGTCSGEYSSHHTCIIYSLDPGRPYYYYVFSALQTDSSAYAADTNGGNYYSFTTTTDTTPPIITPDNNPLILTDTQVAISWTTDERASSWMLYDTTSHLTHSNFASMNFDPNDPSYNPYANNLANTNLSHIFVMSLGSLTPNTTYYYRMVSEDVSGNVTVGPEDFFTTKEIQIDHPDLVNPKAPNQYNPIVAQYSDTEAVAYLPTANTGATSKLCWDTSAIPNADSCVNHIDIAGATEAHYYHLSGLSPDTEYHIKTKITDSQTPTISFTSRDVIFKTKKIQIDQHAPLSNISTPREGDITKADNYVIVNWTTDQAANQTLTCGEDKGIYTDTTDDPTHYNASHSLKLIGLSADTKYYCQVTSEDDLGNSLSSSEFSFTTDKNPEFQHDPLSKIMDIADPPKLITDKNAVITFYTDQPALCLAEATTSQGAYTTPLIYQENGYVQKTNYNLAHSINFTSLIFTTKYYYRITCEDNLNTVISSDEYSFTTSDQLFSAKGFGELADKTPPVISNIGTIAITGESVTITWDTDEKSNSLVKFGAVTVDENVAGNAAVNSDPTNYVTSHSVVINGLIPATKYLFVIISPDVSGNMATSTEQSFTTAAPSSISSIQVISTSLNQATITWNSGVKTTSSIEYGLRDIYGQIKEDTALTQAHSISLSGLQFGQTYHYRVKGKDQNNNLYASADNTFVPKSPPSLSNIKVDNVTEHSATIIFSTNVPTDALVNFTDPKSKDNSGSQGKADLTTSHELNLSNLTPGTTFAISIKVRDQDGNETTQQAPNLTTGKDDTPPKIDQIITDTALTQNDEVQTIISWTTDEPATTFLKYRDSINGEEKESQISDNYTTTHVAVSTLFKPGTVYYFRVKSIDVSGNEAVSQDYALLTPKRKENIIQIIVANFQGIFSWMKLN